MKQKYTKIWILAKEYLKQGVAKDFVLHTEGVVRAMEILLKEERAEENILIPAAILHDVGWAKVPKDLQKASSKSKRIKALKLHIANAPTIILEILNKCHYSNSQARRIIEIVTSHKFKNPRNLEKRLLIDADQLSDAFKKQFYSDAMAYQQKEEDFYLYRLNSNKFYTKSAKAIFLKQMNLRKKEIRLSFK